MSLPRTPHDDPALAEGRKPPATADQAMVATSHPAVTEVALDVLRAGGTAVDAMLTAIPLQQVLEPQLSTIAGGFGMLYWDAATGRPYYLNANPDHASGPLPGSASPDTSGARVAVPATVAGMHAAAERFGTQPWGSYFGPAIAAADDGYPVYAQLSSALRAARGRISRYSSGRERYLPDGYLPPVGRSFRQPRLAATLHRVAQPDGAEWFQHGDFARRFVVAVRETGGTLTDTDLAGYQPRWDEPLRFTFAGHDVLGAPLPDTGGLYCALALAALERNGLDRGGPWLTSAAAVALIAQAQAEAEAHVDSVGADPRADPPTGVGSNQLVIVDRAGNWVTMLHTGYGTDFGTGLVVDGVGVNGANVFPGLTTGPGRRIVAPLASTLVLRDGRPWLALGSPGFPPPYVTLVLLNVLGYGMGLPEAVEAPRFAYESDAEGPLAVETRIPQPTLDGLERLGLRTVPLGDYNPVTGRMQAVLRQVDDGRLLGVVDSRGSGRATGIS